MFLRIAVLLFAILLPLSGATKKLYLRGGTDLLVSEYHVLEDRVRYYSVERSAWEEIPLELVDLERTRREEERQTEIRAEREREDRIEREAERRARTELHNVPIEDGVYYLDGDKAVPVKQSTVTLEGSKKRAFLQVLSPIPAIAGKTTAELEGETSAFAVSGSRPMFYLRLERISRFGIVSVTAKKEKRVVQVIQTVPQSKEMFEEQEEIEVFRQQLAPNVYKVWPVEPIPPGEYAVIEYTPGEANIRVWDFSLRPSASDGVPPPVPDGSSPAQTGKDR